MRIIVAMAGNKINWRCDTKDFANFLENKRMELSVRFRERLVDKNPPLGILLMTLTVICFLWDWPMNKKYSLIRGKRR
jgi:hypothetical protein